MSFDTRDYLLYRAQVHRIVPERSFMGLDVPLLGYFRYILSEVDIYELGDLWRDVKDFLDTHALKKVRQILKDYKLEKFEDIKSEELWPLFVIPYVQKMEIDPGGWTALCNNLFAHLRLGEQTIKITSLKDYSKLPSSVSLALTLLVILAAYVSSRRKSILLLLEEPELHTHPLQAVLLGMVLAYLAERNVKQIINGEAHPVFTIITTHSPDLVKGVLYKKDLVSIHVFRRKDQIIEAEYIDSRETGLIPSFAEAIFVGSEIGISE